MAGNHQVYVHTCSAYWSDWVSPVLFLGVLLTQNEKGIQNKLIYLRDVDVVKAISFLPGSSFPQKGCGLQLGGLQLGAFWRRSGVNGKAIQSEGNRIVLTPGFMLTPE